MQSAIGSTIIQRTFVPNALNQVLNVATIPISELGLGASNDPVRALVAEIAGIPIASVVDHDSYQVIARGTIDIIRHGPPPLAEYYYFFHSRRIRDTQEREGVHRLVRDAIALLLSGTPPTSYPFPWPGFPEFADIVKKPEHDINSDGYATAFACALAGIAITPEVNTFADSLGEYHIPLGQSPTTDADSLLTLIEKGKTACLAPLAVGGLVGGHALFGGHFLLALETIATAGAMTLLLIGTVSVADLLVRHAIHKRPRE